MKNSMLYVGVIVVGVIALIIGVLYLANVFGDHPTRAYVALGAGVVLVIIGIGGMMMSRTRGPVQSIPVHELVGLEQPRRAFDQNGLGAAI